MGLYDLIRRWLGPEQVKANPVGPLTVASSPGSNAQPHDFDLAAHAKVYLVDIYCYAAIRAIARDVAATPLIVQRSGFDDDGEPSWDIVTDGDLFDLFANTNSSNESWEHLCERWVIGLLGTGNGYLIYDGADRDLHFVQSEWVKANVSDGGKLLGYEIKNTGVTYNADVDEMIHVKLANPTGQWYGMPPGEVLKNKILTKLGLDRYLKAFFNNNGQLGTILSTDQSLNEDQRKNIRKEFNKLHAGADNAFKIAVLERGTSIANNAPLIKDLVPDAIDKLIRQEVCAAYGVPPIKITYLDEATYNNVEVQDRVYQRGTVEPIRRNIRQVLNTQLVKRKFSDDGSLRLWHDVSEIPGLQDDMNELSTRIQGEYKSGLITLNEAREPLGYEPIDEGGDEFRAAPMIGFEEDAGGDDDDKSMKPSHRRIVVVDPRVTLWLDHEKRLTKAEKNFVAHLVKYFNDQRQRMIDRINGVTDKGAFMSRLGVKLMTKTDFDDDNPIPREIIADIFDIQEENAALKAAMGGVIERDIEQAGQQALDQMRLSLGFNVHNPQVQVVIEQFKNQITVINEATYRDIKKLLSEAYEAGDGIGVIERRLRETYSHFNKVRSTNIARTEMNGIVNGGTQLAYEQGSIEGKQWLAVQAGNVRRSHQIIDGETVRVNERFPVGEDMLLYPGDPSGSAAEVCNCRCTTIGVIEDD